jgi:ABC-2 type transport system ATP-binding protein
MRSSVASGRARGGGVTSDGKREGAAAQVPADQVAIRTVGLTRRFGNVLAVDRLDLAIAPGTIFGLLGSNGAGKSTTLRMLTTLLPPTGGTAVVAGFDVCRQAREVRRRIGYVPQMLSADATLTGYENLILSAKLYAIPRFQRRERIEQALAFMELSDVARTLVRNYSGGMIRRLEIAQSLLHRPAVLFLDEPTVGLDPLARRAVWDRLMELRVAGGTTVLLTTHDMEEADTLCQTVGIMQHGRIVALGSPAELEAAVGPGATMADVFVRQTGGTAEEGGGYRDVARTRRTARRLS